jgi:hypothetical protein
MPAVPPVCRSAGSRRQRTLLPLHTAPSTPFLRRCVPARACGVARRGAARLNKCTHMGCGLWVGGHVAASPPPPAGLCRCARASGTSGSRAHARDARIAASGRAARRALRTCVGFWLSDLHRLRGARAAAIRPLGARAQSATSGRAVRTRLHAASLGATVSNVPKIQTLKFQEETDMPTARAAMAPAVPVFGTVGLSFAGWVLMLAGIGALQVCALSGLLLAAWPCATSMRLANLTHAPAPFTTAGPAGW